MAQVLGSYENCPWMRHTARRFMLWHNMRNNRIISIIETLPLTIWPHVESANGLISDDNLNCFAFILEVLQVFLMVRGSHDAGIAI